MLAKKMDYKVNETIIEVGRYFNNEYAVTCRIKAYGEILRNILDPVK